MAALRSEAPVFQPSRDTRIEQRPSTKSVLKERTACSAIVHHFARAVNVYAWVLRTKANPSDTQHAYIRPSCGRGAPRDWAELRTRRQCIWRSYKRSTHPVMPRKRQLQSTLNCVSLLMQQDAIADIHKLSCAPSSL